MHTERHQAAARRIATGIEMNQKRRQYGSVTERDKERLALLMQNYHFYRDMIIGVIGILCMAWVFYVALICHLG